MSIPPGHTPPSTPWIPERASKLNTVARCPGFNALQSAGADRVTAAANTGSAHHRLVELHHLGKHPLDALEIVRSEGDQWPLADYDEAEKWAVKYRADPRNRTTGTTQECITSPGPVIATELTVRCAIPCDPSDPTGEPIVLSGHVDQIRRGPDGLFAWDVKTGKGGGASLLYNAAWQLAAYAVAASQTLGDEVWCGGVIRTRGYVTRKTYAPGEEPVFFHAGWSLEQCYEILTSAAYVVAQLRRGEILTTPGDHCNWCPGGGPANCGAMLRDLA